MFFLGIDPGLTGAVALISGQYAQTWDAPTRQVRTKAGKSRTVHDVPGMVEIIRDALGRGPCWAVIEEVMSTPNDGHVGAFRFGLGAGLWQGIVASHDLNPTLVRPQTWKTAFGLTGQSKDGSLELARSLFPSAELGRAKDHGRAEALLLAEYARRFLCASQEDRGS